MIFDKFKQKSIYNNFPKILCHSLADKMTYANIVDQDQTAAVGAI